MIGDQVFNKESKLHVINTFMVPTDNHEWHYAINAARPGMPVLFKLSKYNSGKIQIKIYDLDYIELGKIKFDEAQYLQEYVEDPKYTVLAKVERKYNDFDFKSLIIDFDIYPDLEKQEIGELSQRMKDRIKYKSEEIQLINYKLRKPETKKKKKKPGCLVYFVLFGLIILLLFAC